MQRLSSLSSTLEWKINKGDHHSPFMPRSSSNKKSKSQKAPPSFPERFPDHLRREHHLYLEAVVESANRGFFVCAAENNMSFLARADKLEKLYRVRMLPGDKVVVECDLRNLDPSADRQRGRIVWRHRKPRV